MPEPITFITELVRRARWRCVKGGGARERERGKQLGAQLEVERESGGAHRCAECNAAELDQPEG